MAFILGVVPLMLSIGA
nr:hypothetical protein [Rosenbergiella collisarenosi]